METALPIPAHAMHLRLKGRGIVIVIGIFKLLKGLLMILAAVCALELARTDVNQHVRDLINTLDIGPFRGRIGAWIDNKLLGFNAKEYAVIATGAAIYATVFFTEGAGLLMDKLWAEWMVVVSTSLLIPVEIVEIYRHKGVVMTFTFIGNVIVATYLVFHVRRRIREHRAEREHLVHH